MRRRRQGEKSIDIARRFTNAREHDFARASDRKASVVKELLSNRAVQRNAGVFQQKTARAQFVISRSAVQVRAPAPNSLAKTSARHSETGGVSRTHYGDRVAATPTLSAVLLVPDRGRERWRNSSLGGGRSSPPPPLPSSLALPGETSAFADAPLAATADRRSLGEGGRSRRTLLTRSRLREVLGATRSGVQ